MDTEVSEYHLFDTELLDHSDGIFINGVGWIAQHHSWIDQFYSKGMCYFMRDLKCDDLRNAKDRDTRIRLTSELFILNSNIKAWEDARKDNARVDNSN